MWRSEGNSANSSPSTMGSGDQTPVTCVLSLQTPVPLKCSILSGVPGGELSRRHGAKGPRVSGVSGRGLAASSSGQVALSAVNCSSGAPSIHSHSSFCSERRGGAADTELSRAECFINVSQATGGHCPAFQGWSLKLRLGRAPCPWKLTGTVAHFLCPEPSSHPTQHSLAFILITLVSVPGMSQCSAGVPLIILLA